MMMALGMFVFGLPTLAYETLERSTEWRHPSNSRVGAMPAYQFIGKGQDTISLAGRLIPDVAGSGGSLTLLRRMADTGRAYVLVSGMGRVYGAYVITDLKESESLHYVNGMPQRTEFTISLTCVSDAEARSLLDDLQLPIGHMDGSVLDWSL
ncbi:Phage protein U [Bordetella ansorpii]|uniref:Phage protein U n=1 Tax=Bordetella ansorpii TaxID=288768 RepID=A0A157QP36_9BORD|nr:phage tail protein [Bordetella ansorpii]SAI47537.1 Phage protein U [Bordetella ansorpii]